MWHYFFVFFSRNERYHSLDISCSLRAFDNDNMYNDYKYNSLGNDFQPHLFQRLQCRGHIGSPESKERLLRQNWYDLFGHISIVVFGLQLVLLDFTFLLEGWRRKPFIIEIVLNNFEMVLNVWMKPVLITMMIHAVCEHDVYMF